MLSTATIDVIKSTVPLLEQHGEAITTHFYELLFAENPELRNVFNQVNQARGEQPRALADAVLAYAQNIDNLGALLPAVERIANKHVSLGVVSEQYPLVGKSLLAAIQNVLELPEDHPAITAWGEAYQVLADIFIDKEESIYADYAQAEGGWRGFKEFTIDNIVVETPRVKSFYLKPSDGGIPPFKGGQFVGIKANPEASEFDVIRQYSCSGQPGKDTLRITTKNEFEGLMSGHLHQSKVGSKLFVQAPSGVFTVNYKAEKHIFVAAGVGITPLIGMIYELLQNGAKPTDILLVQCARNREEQVLREELSALQSDSGLHFKSCFSEGEGGDAQGHINAEVLQQWLTEADITVDGASAIYFCGPKPFMSALNQEAQSLGFSEDNIHYEVFGPTVAL